MDEKNFYETTLNLTNIKCQEIYYEKCRFGNKICCSYYDREVLDCIPSEKKCDNITEIKKNSHFFKCKNTNKCVKELTECRSKEDYGQCEYMQFYYPKEKEYLCFKKNEETKCETVPNNYLCEDGICRADGRLKPSEIICPFDKILCPDLTCRDDLSECYTDYPECGENQVRCPDQSCVDTIELCPTTMTCVEFGLKVCPDGTCTFDNKKCPRLKTCPEDQPFLCADYTCAKNAESCSHFPACGTGQILCANTRKCSESCKDLGDDREEVL